MRIALSLVMIAMGAGALGCGETWVAFHGTVLRGDAKGYTFDDQRNPRGLPPVGGARVRVYGGNNEGDCVDAAWWHESEEKKRAYVTRTAADGRFDVTETFGGGPWNVYVIICADKEGFEPFVYKIVHGETSDPERGEKEMNIVLEPLGTASAPKAR